MQAPQPLRSKLQLATELEKQSLSNTELLKRDAVAFHIQLRCQQLCKNDSKKYARKMRNIAHALKQNEILRLKVVEDEVSSDKLLKMTNEELATCSMKEKRAKVAKVNLKKHIRFEPLDPLKRKQYKRTSCVKYGW